MLNMLPIIGSILLTIIIVWIAISVWHHRIRWPRYVVTRKRDGIPARSLCCGATTTPLGWTADGWVARCDFCLVWQYLGDDHRNPPPGFNLDGTPQRGHAGGLVEDWGKRPYIVGERPSDHAVPFRLLTEVTSDEGEPMEMPPQPNIGGEGHPSYQGPHYDMQHDRFVPYDMLHDPIPGTAVHKVGNVAVAGPLPADQGKTDDDDHRSS